MYVIQQYAVLEGFAITSSKDELQINKAECYIIIQLDASVGMHFNDFERSAYTSILGNGPKFFYGVIFDDIDMMAKLIVAISRSDFFAIDNDHGLIIGGDQFANRFFDNPSWNWPAADI